MPSARKLTNGKDIFKAWLPGGYSQIFRSYVFGHSGFWTMAPLCYAAKFDPFLSLDCARVEGMGDQILPYGNLGRQHHSFTAK